MMALLLALAGVGHAGVAILELYTSEGCSSCPPADALLNALVAEASARGEAIYPLAFHVDYWNYLGWSDAFSSPAWAARQRAWADHLRVSGMYTPQLVVSGRTELLGSDSAAVRAAITASLAHAAPVAITVRASGSGPLSVDVSVTGLTGSGALELALVEDGLSSEVRRGENAGRTLRHDHVVRALTQANLVGSGEVHLQLAVPVGVNLGRATLVAWVQDARTWEVLGAMASPVLSPP